MQREFNTLLYKNPRESRFKSLRNELSMFDYLVDQKDLSDFDFVLIFAEYD